MNQPNEEVVHNKVLIIDDDEIDLLINRRCIEIEAFARIILSEQSALSALEYLKQVQYDEAQIPDFILLDMEMPEMDGFEFLEEFDRLSLIVREKTKILMISSSLDSFKISKALQNKYVSDFIDKPLTRQKVKALRDFIPGNVQRIS